MAFLSISLFKSKQKDFQREKCICDAQNGWDTVSTYVHEELRDDGGSIPMYCSDL